MAGNLGKVISLLSGLGVGGVFGIYLSQNYVVPDVGELIGKVQNKVEQYTKDGDDRK